VLKQKYHSDIIGSFTKVSECLYNYFFNETYLRNSAGETGDDTGQ
jgi:hypothetical protein